MDQIKSAAALASNMVNALTIDVEDYNNILSRDWLSVDRSPTDAVVRNTAELLDLLAAAKTFATFFILGEVAQTFPQLVRRIADAGHEVGIHSYRHQQVFKLSREEFAADASDARKRVEDAAGAHVFGFRAPAFSIGPDTAWALDILANLGFRYDSSVFPFAGRRYGWPGFSPDIHEVKLSSGCSIIEAPMSIVEFLGRPLPACGGGYMRHFPYWVTRWAMRRVQLRRPAIVYLHPYELDVVPPPQDITAVLAKAPKKVQRFHAIQIHGRGGMRQKIVNLLSEFKFTRMIDVIESAQATPSA